MARERATKKQQELLQFFTAFVEEHKYAPSYREIMTSLGYKSVSTVAVHVDALVAKGFLVKSDNYARSIRLASEAAKDNEHTSWLKAEIARRESIGAEQSEVETLKKALELLET